MTSPHARTRRQLPERIRRLRWLRESLRDPPGCARTTEVDEMVLTTRNLGDGRIEMRCSTSRDSQKLVDEFFGRRYRLEVVDGEPRYLGRPA